MRFLESIGGGGGGAVGRMMSGWSIQNTCTGMHEIFNTSEVINLLNSLLKPTKYLFIFARGMEIFESQTSTLTNFTCSLSPCLGTDPGPKP